MNRLRVTSARGIFKKMVLFGLIELFLLNPAYHPLSKEMLMLNYTAYSPQKEHFEVLKNCTEQAICKKRLKDSSI
jgi:hypothetical protein